MTPEDLGAEASADSAEITRDREGAARSRSRWRWGSPTATTASRRTARATSRRPARASSAKPSQAAFCPGPGPLPGAALLFPDPRRYREPRSQMQPGFVDGGHVRQSADGLPPANGHTSGRRLALAEWLASPDNPLTARVMVNRIWHHHFGRGIVATLDNFGKMGERRRIRNCWTGWPSNSCIAAGASSRCTG